MKPLRVAMRADASVVIGTGHVSRCLTLAAGLRARGGQVRMVSRDLPEYLRELVISEGHEYAGLAGALSQPDRDLVHSDWLGTGQASDARETVAALSDGAWDWIVVDHYAIDARWERTLRATSVRVMAIDDLADRMHDCHLLLDQNLHDNPTRYAPRVPAEAAVLLGPTFALLRDEFRVARAHAHPRTGEVRRLLIFMGGGDADNHTARAIAACVQAGIGPGQVDVVIGAGHAHRNEIEVACGRAQYVCHVQTSKMAHLMLAADLAIGAAGSASWERCAVGLPTVSLAAALNQRGILAGLAERGAVIQVAAETTAIADAVLRARRDPALVRAMSLAAWELVDGFGVDRVCDAMEAAA